MLGGILYVLQVVDCFDASNSPYVTFTGRLLEEQNVCCVVKTIPQTEMRRCFGYLKIWCAPSLLGLGLPR